MMGTHSLFYVFFRSELLPFCIVLLPEMAFAIVFDISLSKRKLLSLLYYCA